MLEEEVMEEEPRMKSTVTAGGRTQKGRGFKDGAEPERYPGGKFESLEAGTGPGPAKCAPRCESVRAPSYTPFANAPLYSREGLTRGVFGSSLESPSPSTRGLHEIDRCSYPCAFSCPRLPWSAGATR
jgi:hypothetical protein